ncbi:MAG: hypothetical protein R2883_04465 [Caldisericia bacterium]
MEKSISGKYYATRVTIWAEFITLLGLIVPLLIILFSTFGVYVYTRITEIVLYSIMGFAVLLLLIIAIFYEKLAKTNIEYISSEGERDVLKLSSVWGDKVFKGPFYFNAYIQTKQQNAFEVEKRKSPAYFRIDIKLARSKRITILEKIPNDTKLPGSRRIEARVFWEPDYRSSTKFQDHSGSFIKG